MTEEVRVKLSIDNKKRVANGSHNFLGPETNRRNNKKRVANGTHNFLGPEFNKIHSRKNNLKRVANGTHHFLNGGMVTAFNIETCEVHRIPKKLYDSRRDIYFTMGSNVYKEWKRQQEVTQ